MQEEVENKTINLAITTTKLTFNGIARLVQMYLQHRKNAKFNGKQSIKTLLRQKQGVTSMDIRQTDLKDFERFAKKFGVDFAITKDKTQSPPKYTVFFKAHDADALQAAFEQCQRYRDQNKEKPSVLKTLQKLKEKAKSIPNQVRNRKQEREL